MSSVLRPALTVRTRLVLGVAMAVFAAAFGFLVWNDMSGGGAEPRGETMSLAIGFASFFGIGMAIASRRPGHPIGWLFVAAGIYPLVQQALAVRGEMQMEDGSTTLYVIAHTAFSWPVFLGILVVFVPLLFPTGRLPSARWRGLAWTAGVAMGVMAVGGVIQRDICVTYDAAGSCVEAISNPIGVPWLPSVEEGVFGAVMLGILALCMVGALASVVVRYRRAQGVERVQMRWVTFAMSLFITYMLAVGVLVEEVLGLTAELQELVPFGIDLFGIFLALIPISVGMAILRYRLYDIDRLVSRTVTYAAVTALLVGAYVAVVFTVGRLFPSQDSLAVAASTLTVAALFNPVRRRIQRAVDQRFNRPRYDAERTVEEFGRRLRREGAHLASLEKELGGIVATAMQPTSLSVWVKDEPA